MNAHDLLLLIPLSGIALAFLVLAVRDSKTATAIFCGLLPTYLFRFSLPGFSAIGLLAIPTTFLEMIFLELTLTWLITGAWRRASPTLSRWLWPLLFLSLGALLGTAIAPDIRAALGLLRAYIIEPILLFLIFSSVIDDAGSRRAVLACLGGSMAVIGLSGVIQKITGWGIPFVWWNEPGRRVTSFYRFPNAVGLFVAPIAMLMIGWGIGAIRRATTPKNRMLGLLPLAASVLAILAIVFAVSEGAAIGLAAGLLVAGLVWKPSRAVTLVAFSVACAAIMAIAPIRDYVTDKATLADDSGSVRIVVWKESLTMLAEHPIFGAGLSGYPAILVPYHKSDWVEIFQYPHNIVLNFWTELGLIGLFGFILAVLAFFKDTLRFAREHQDEWLPAALIGAMVVLLIHGLVDVPYFKNDLAYLFWIIIGLAESVRRSGVESLKFRV